MIKYFIIAILMLVGVVSPSVADDQMPGVKRPGSLVVCADSYDFPAAMKDTDPPGYDIEIIRAIAKVLGSPLEYVWTDTGTRGGLGRALRNSILQKKCNLFVGLGVSGASDDEMKEKHLVFTAPYMSEGFVLVEKGQGTGKISLLDFKDVNIGVAMTTPADSYLFDHGYHRSIFFRDRAVLKALDKGEVDAALIWSPALGYLAKDFPGTSFRIATKDVPEAGLRWNVAIALPERETALKSSLDGAIAELLKNGEIRRIIESYGVPFYPPAS